MHTDIYGHTHKETQISNVYTKKISKRKTKRCRHVCVYGLSDIKIGAPSEGCSSHINPGSAYQTVVSAVFCTAVSYPTYTTTPNNPGLTR